MKNIFPDRNLIHYDTVIVGLIKLTLPAIAVKKIFPSKKPISVANGLEVLKNLQGAKKQLIEQSDGIIAVSNFTSRS